MFLPDLSGLLDLPDLLHLSGRELFLRDLLDHLDLRDLDHL